MRITACCIYLLMAGGLYLALRGEGISVFVPLLVPIAVVCAFFFAVGMRDVWVIRARGEGWDLDVLKYSCFFLVGAVAALALAGLCYAFNWVAV